MYFNQRSLIIGAMLLSTLTAGKNPPKIRALGETIFQSIGTPKSDLPSSNVLLPRMRSIQAFGLVLLALLPFLLNLNGYFLADDFVLLSWTQVHSLNGVFDFFDPDAFWFYRPLVKVYYWIGQSIFGLHPAPFHLFSTLLHAANGYLVYMLISRQLGSGYRTAGLIAAPLFMLVPYHAETVSWIAAIGDLIAAFCILSALILFQRHRARRNRGYLCLSIALFTLGLFTRETTIILPILLALDLLLNSSKEGTRATLLVKLNKGISQLGGYVVVTVLYLTIQLLGRSDSMLERGGLTFHALSIDSILLAVMDYVHGLLPGGSSIAGLPLDTLRWVIWVEASIVLLIAIFLWRSRQSLALFGLMWMLLTPLLFVFFSAPTDRYFYLPSIGYAIFVASLLAGLMRFASGKRIPMSAALQAVVMAVVAGLLLSQTTMLVAKQTRWRTAGQVSGGIVHDTQQAISDPHDYGAFYFVGIPATLNGIPLFGNGLQQAIQLVYDNRTLAASLVTCAYLQTQQELPRYSYFLRFKGDGVEQLGTKEECD